MRGWRVTGLGVALLVIGAVGLALAFFATGGIAAVGGVLGCVALLLMAADGLSVGPTGLFGYPGDSPPDRFDGLRRRFRPRGRQRKAYRASEEHTSELWERERTRRRAADRG
jgi:hypothetical protein